MAYYFSEPSRTFSEYLLVPGYSSSECVPANVSLRTPIVKFKKGEQSALYANIPLVSAIMQAVSDDKMAIALAREGGISFIYGSQSVESEAAMVARVKAYKAGFIVSDSNIKPDQTLADILALKKKTGHSTVAVTDDGTATGKLLGIVTSRDYRISRMSTEEKVESFMTPFEKLITAPADTTLKEANNIIWDHKLNSLPLVDENQHLVYMVFRKDYDTHKENALELLDKDKRYIVGAGINTRDYAERVPALVEAGADVLCIDSSEGFSEWQSRTIAWIREHYGDTVRLAQATSLTARASASWQRLVRTSSRSVSAAALSASPVSRRVSVVVRQPQLSRLQQHVTSTTRRPVSISRSARTAVSYTTTMLPWHWQWAQTSSCSAVTSPVSTSRPPTRSISAAPS